MAKMEQNSDEPVFTIDIRDICELNQEQLDELKYLDVPDNVWIEIQQDLEKIPPLIPITPKEKNDAEDKTNEERFLDIFEQDFDDIASENYATNTKSQTRWALKTFRTNNFTF